jgi:DHA1 family bicyclomycin/chloramphenicol resistance-like MFS transporter
MMKEHRGFLFLLVFLSMLGPFTLNVLVPSLPGMAEYFNAPKASVQLTLSLYLVGMAISQLILGPMADWLGRRPVLLGALVLYVVSSIAAFLAPNVELLIIARIVQSFGATAGIALGRTMIRDTFATDRAASVIGYVTMGMVVAPMIAPSVGALLDDTLGWRAILGFCVLVGVAMLLVAWPNLPETRPETLVAATARQVAERSMALLGNVSFMAFWGASAFCSGIFFAYLGSAPYLVIEIMGRSKAEYGLWFVSLSIGYAAGNFISGRMAQKLGVYRLVWWGNLVGLLAALIMLSVALSGVLTPFWLFLPAMIGSFGNGLVLPNAIAGGLSADPKAAGAGSGLMGFGQMGVGAICSFIGGKLTEVSAMPLAVIMLVCAVLALFSGWLARRDGNRAA